MATSASADAGTKNPNESHFEGLPVEIGGYSTLRAQALAAIQTAANDKTPTDDAMSALAQSLSNAPGSAVLAIELVKAAVRAHDQRKVQRFAQIAQSLSTEQPNLLKILGTIAGTQRAGASRLKTDAPSPTAGVRLSQIIAGIANLEAVCDWLKKAFAEGRPPVNDMGQQGADSVECRLLSAYALSPEIQAVPVVAAARGQGERVFAWVAAKYKGAVWLSPSLVAISAPSFHPHGNGFSIELQRTATYREGEPELAAFITERHTVIDVALNEKTVSDQQRIVVMTFDLEPPQVSGPIVLYTKTERSLVDPNDNVIPKGYRHSLKLGSPVEQTFQLQWGENRVKLNPVGLATATPAEQVLFGE